MQGTTRELRAIREEAVRKPRKIQSFFPKKGTRLRPLFSFARAARAPRGYRVPARRYIQLEGTRQGCRHLLLRVWLRTRPSSRGETRVCQETTHAGGRPQRPVRILRRSCYAEAPRDAFTAESGSYVRQGRFEGAHVEFNSLDGFPCDFVLPGPQLLCVAHSGLERVLDGVALGLRFVDEALRAPRWVVLSHPAPV